MGSLTRSALAQRTASSDQPPRTGPATDHARHRSALEAADGDFEAGHAFLAGDGRLIAAADGGDEGLQLGAQRLGMPLSLLEAAACGRPLVATDVPGCRDIARAGVNALLVPLDDAEALADAIERLALDAELRHKFGAASRELVASQFSSERIGSDLVRLYRRLLERTA